MLSVSSKRTVDHKHRVLTRLYVVDPIYIQLLVYYFLSASIMEPLVKYIKKLLSMNVNSGEEALETSKNIRYSPGVKGDPYTAAGLFKFPIPGCTICSFLLESRIWAW